MKQKNTAQAGLFDGPKNKVWTISELTAEVRAILENRFSPIVVIGEISRITRASSGHMYFQLKDENAAIDAVMFRSAAARIPRSVPADGIQVECEGRMTMYEPRGKAQLVVEHMRPRGEGALALRLQELKTRLLKEGLFDQARKRQLPFAPQVIGVVTSPSGAAIQDILKVLGRRAPNVDVIIAPALVQGHEAPGAIANGIHLLESTGQPEVIIIGRGGGSLEDLWAFNEEQVVRAVAECSIPVVSAVGHETDFVLTDLAADLRAPTPSAAAELVVPDRQELSHTISSLIQKMAREMEWKIGSGRAEIQDLVSKMQDPRLILAHHRMKLDDMSRRMADMVSSVINSNRTALLEYKVKLAAFEPKERLSRERQKMFGLEHRLVTSIRHVLASRRAELESELDSLASLSPLAVLNRGYSLVYGPDGKLVRDAQTLKKDDLLRVRASSGNIRARVISTFDDENK